MYYRDEERDLPELDDEDYERVVAALEDAAENPDLPHHLRREAERMLRRIPRRQP